MSSDDEGKSSGDGLVYHLRENDCMDNISARHGFFWKTLWDHPKNKELKEKRNDPFVLLAGDEVFIPKVRQQQVPCSTETRHSFKRKGVPSRLKIYIQIGGKPLANERYMLVLDGVISEGSTDGDGLLDIPIPPQSAKGELTIGDPEFPKRVIHLDLGSMDPISEIIGVQKRLNNIGFSCLPTGVIDDQTHGAILDFQKAFDLEATGTLDDKTRDRIRKEYGS